VFRAARDLGAAVAGFEADVTDPSQVDAYIRQVLDRFGGLDIALLNAGVEACTCRSAYSPETFAMAVNAGAVWLGLRAAVADEEARRRIGRHYLIDPGRRRSPTRPPTPPHAVIGMMKTPRSSSQRTVSNNCVIPGMTDRPWTGPRRSARRTDAGAVGDHLDASLCAAEIAHLMLLRRRKQPHQVDFARRGNCVVDFAPD
jgi:NAD(P)-dependent dehydrogenase (short-subunit alcohol dehydrogenase family)